MTSHAHMIIFYYGLAYGIRNKLYYIIINSSTGTSNESYSFDSVMVFCGRFFFCFFRLFLCLTLPDILNNLLEQLQSQCYRQIDRAAGWAREPIAHPMQESKKICEYVKLGWSLIRNLNKWSCTKAADAVSWSSTLDNFLCHRSSWSVTQRARLIQPNTPRCSYWYSCPVNWRKYAISLLYKLYELSMIEFYSNSLSGLMTGNYEVHRSASKCIYNYLFLSNASWRLVKHYKRRI